MATLYMFLAYLFAMVGALACGIGILATMPIMYIAQAVAYHKIVGGDTAVFTSPSQYPRAPQDLQNMPAAPTDWSAGSSATPAPPSEPAPPSNEPMSGSMAGDESTVAEMPAYSPGVAADDAPTMAETPIVAPHADDMPTMAETPAVSADDMPTMGTMDAIQPNDEPKPPHN